MNTTESLEHTLKTAFNAEAVEIVDNSWQHAGHAAMQGKPQGEATHVSIVVVSAQFEGVNTLNRHRMVHKVLKDAFETHLHALELKTYTPLEWKP